MLPQRESSSKPAAAVDGRKLLTAFFAEIHRREYSCGNWQWRLVRYVQAGEEQTIKRVLYELCQLETRLVLNMHQQVKAGLCRDYTPEEQHRSCQAWIRTLAETVEAELALKRERLAELNRQDAKGAKSSATAGGRGRL